MAIEKSIRIFSEKNTSVQTDIPRIQSGIINHRCKASGVIVVPTNIKDPRHITVNAKSASAGVLLQRSFVCTLALVRASNAAVSTALALSASAADGTYKLNQLRLIGRKLYRLKLYTATTARLASASLLSTYWEELQEFGTNEQVYLALDPAYGTIVNNAELSFQVYGY